MNQQQPDPVQRYLRDLPRAMPDAGLGQAIVQRHLRRRRWRQRAPWLAAAAAVLTAVLWQPQRSEPSLLTPLAPPMAAAAVDPAWVDIRALDRRLQAAYSDGADSQSVELLWQQRQQAVLRLQSEPDTSTRELRL